MNTPGFKRWFQMRACTPKKRGEEHRNKLYECLQKYGVGEWRKMKETHFPEYDVLALRIKVRGDAKGDAYNDPRCKQLPRS